LSPGGDLNGDGLLDLIFGQNAGAPVAAQFGQSALAADGAAPAAVQHPVAIVAKDAAAYSPVVAPGEWMTVFGQGFLPAGTPSVSWSPADFQHGDAPDALYGTSVSINGQPAAIAFVSPTQINLQVPDVAPGYARVAVTSRSGMSTVSVLVATAAPELFVAGGTQYPAATSADNQPIGDPASIPGARPAKPGETIILYGTGFGPASPHCPAGKQCTAASLATTPIIQIGDRLIAPDYAGLTGIGLNQINVTLPADLTAGAYTLRAVLGQTTSQKGLMLVVQ
jgi:uncharacterized protein (TIGR03437 family)